MLRTNMISGQWLSLVSVCLLAFSLPFEIGRPLLTFGAFRLTNVELLLFSSIFFSVLAVIQERRWQQANWLKIPKPWLILLGLFILFLVASALLAPEFRLNALKAALRSVSGVLLALLLPQIILTKDHLKYLIAALLAGGFLTVSFGLAEVWLDKTLDFLDLFRIQPTVAGPFVRLSGSFDHANQMAMYIEATLPFLIGSVWLFGRKKRWPIALVGSILIFLYLQASFLTYSRSSFATILLCGLIIGGMLWLWQPQRRRLALLWGSIAGIVLILIISNTLISPVLRLRLSSEGDNEWYNVSFVVPEQIEMEAGTVHDVTITVINEGSLLWSSELEKPINLGGRWYRVSDDARSEKEMRWPLEREVAPGESLQTTVPLPAPHEVGEYEFEWDLVQEGIVWFSLRNGLHITSSINVVPATGSAVSESDIDEFTGARPTVQPIPGRRVLWSIAARQLLDRPLLGIGLDNFRLTYGQVMGWEAWNDSIHTNNMYVETAVSVGLLGSVSFFGWLALLGLDILNHFRYKRINIWQIAVSFALLAYFIHGLLDYFLLFNGTGLLFWILVGLWMVLAWPEQSE